MEKNKYQLMLELGGLKQWSVAQEMGISRSLLGQYIKRDYWPKNRKAEFITAIKKLANRAIFSADIPF